MSDWGLWEVEPPKRVHGCSGEGCLTCALPAPMTAALDHAADWRVKADTWFAGLPVGRTFTSEDITRDVGFPAGEQGMNRNNAVGAFIKALKFHNKINNSGYVTSRNKNSNGAVIGVWSKVN